MTRKELDEAWNKHIAATVFVDATVFEQWRAVTLGLIATERECIDRDAIVRALRWAVSATRKDGLRIAFDLSKFADRVEFGEVEVP